MESVLASDYLLEIGLKAALGYVIIRGLYYLRGTDVFYQTSSFDWITTIAIGCMFGAAIADQRIGLNEVFVATFVLLFIHFLLFHYFNPLDQSVEDEVNAPLLLYYENQFMIEAMDRERISRQEIVAAMEEQGVQSLKEVIAVVLEPDSRLSVIREVRTKAPGLPQHWKVHPYIH